MRIKALTLWEPWASLMRCGAKTIETRGWYTAYRGPLLICGAKRWTLQQDAVLRRPEIQRGLLRRLPCYTPLRCKRDMLLGRAACIVDLQDCVPTELLCEDPKDAAEVPFGDFSPFRFGWITTNRRIFNPFPVEGRQRLFDVEVPGSLVISCASAAQARAPKMPPARPHPQAP